MERHPSLNGRMWTILVDWLHEVCSDFRLHDNTLFMAVHLLHTALHHVPPISPNRLQLYGVTALFMASKYEEVLSPELRDFVYITDNAVTREQILAVEAEILALHWPIFGTLYERMINLDSAAATILAMVAISRADLWSLQTTDVADACLIADGWTHHTRSRTRLHQKNELYRKLCDVSHLPDTSKGIKQRILKAQGLLPCFTCLHI